MKNVKICIKIKDNGKTSKIVYRIPKITGMSTNKPFVCNQISALILDKIK